MIHDFIRKILDERVHKKVFVSFSDSLIFSIHAKKKGGVKMGKDRQEKKLRNSGRVQSDRDQSLHYDGATKLSSPEEARRLNDNKRS